MLIDKIYICPVCGRRYPLREDAEKCRVSHPVKVVEWCFCEICGEGWNIGHYGVKQATDLAKECEQRHKNDGNKEGKAAGLYFYTGGKMGKVRCKQGKGEGEG